MKCFDPSINKTIALGAKHYLLNDKNYLKDFSQWDDQIRDWLASQEKIDLSPEHIHVIAFLRNGFSLNKLHPVVRTITAELNRHYGKDKGTVKYFHKLFPGGIHQDFLLAGLPMQDSCC
jgi:TusE/DsrC/DsvC family sulfur relay protein